MGFQILNPPHFSVVHLQRCGLVACAQLLHGDGKRLPLRVQVVLDHLGAVHGGHLAGEKRKGHSNMFSSGKTGHSYLPSSGHSVDDKVRVALSKGVLFVQVAAGELDPHRVTAPRSTLKIVLSLFVLY